ncbi:mucin-5AC [Pelobates cultripes]|uniref:Mucin-5AC n=1 Tax=Pelobates cultripes TaxID=61616 RepID=A0AAD1WWR4_PELCU|nr:mucin-5AC [Pelobates cultripes]
MGTFTGIPLWILLVILGSLNVVLTGPPRISIIQAVATNPDVKAINVAHNGKVCSTWGNFHFKNFDGYVFYFPGTCNYVYSSHCKSTYEDFNIQIRRSVVNNVPVIEKITMKIDELVVQIDSSSVEVNGEVVQLPYGCSGVQIEKNGVYLKVSSKLGLVFMWNEDESLLLELDQKYANQTCGLCGDYSSISINNEFISDGVQITETQFGNLQKMDGPTEQCLDVPPQPKSNCTDYENICEGILMGAAFSNCRSLVDVEQYIETCVKDLCLCNSNVTTLCLCDTFAEYSRQCAHAGGQPQNWRTPDLCPKKCPYNMEYQECGSPCGDTCTNPERVVICEDHCLEGCFCPPGTVFDDISNAGCIPIEKCSCTFNSDTYTAGTSYSTSCSTCVCSAGKWDCQNIPCPATCSIQGGSHITTYDQTHYNVFGDCNYVLSKVCSGYDFTVLAELRKCGLTESETCLKSATVMLNGGETVVVIKPCGSVYVNNIYTQLPLSAAKVTVFRPSSFYIVVETNLGVQIVAQLIPLMQVYVTLDPSFMTKTCGLCGNFNDKQTDDFQTINGVIEGTAASFANTWKTQASCPNVKNLYENPCSLSVQNGLEKYAQHWCGLIADPSGPFFPCHSQVNTEIYIQNCMFDTCNCEKTEDCMCAAVSSYVHACAAKGIILTGWRADVCSNYMNTCPKTLNYTYSVTTCQPTCRSLSEPDVTCNIQFVPVDGCTCTKGYYMDDSGKCVLANACLCYYQGSAVPSGEVVYDNGIQCTCTQGQFSCIGSPVPVRSTCSAPMVYFDYCMKDGTTPSRYLRKACKACSKDYSTKCVSGCVCPEGLVSDGEGKCIAEDQCPCIHNDATYKPGGKVKIKCNTCTCKDRIWQCTSEPCLATCAVYGNGHYITFDGKRYTFNGDCEYTLAQDHCGKSGNSSTFRVITENIPCGTTGTTCSKAIKVFLGSYEIILTDEKLEEVERCIEGKINYKVRHMGIYLVIVADNGLILMWDKRTSIFIKLSKDFENRLKDYWKLTLIANHMNLFNFLFIIFNSKGTVCGLCGNYDGDGNNDFATRSMSVVGDVTEFGNSWKLSPTCPDANVLKDACSANPYRKSWALKQCSIINSPAFYACHYHVDPSKYYDACVTDSCACDTGGECECFCTAVAAYAQVCGEYGVCISWRTPSICPVFCDYYNPEGECEWHYKPCGSPCFKTCRNPSGKCLHELSGLEGCYPSCPAAKPFFDEDKMECVAQCGCYDNKGTYYNIGSPVTPLDNCESCLCTLTGIVCEYDKEACYCEYNCKKYKNNEVIYNTTDGIGGCIIARCKENGTIYRYIYECTTTARPSTTFMFTTTPSTKNTGCYYNLNQNANGQFVPCSTKHITTVNLPTIRTETTATTTTPISSTTTTSTPSTTTETTTTTTPVPSTTAISTTSTVETTTTRSTSTHFRATMPIFIFLLSPFLQVLCSFFLLFYNTLLLLSPIIQAHTPPILTTGRLLVVIIILCEQTLILTCVCYAMPATLAFLYSLLGALYPLSRSIYTIHLEMDMTTEFATKFVSTTSTTTSKFTTPKTLPTSTTETMTTTSTKSQPTTTHQTATTVKTTTTCESCPPRHVANLLHKSNSMKHVCKKNETCLINNCTVATCQGNNVVTIEPVSCPPVKTLNCTNGFPPVKVFSSDGCCYHYECQCVCSGWGDPHYITFDGTYYTFLENCTYVLVQQITPKFGNFRVLVDNYFCDAVDGLSCPQSILIYYNSNEVVLTNTLYNGRMTNRIRFNQNWRCGMIFAIKIPFSLFGYNTEGQCGTCSNNTAEDCRLPNGRIISNCSHMANHWKVNVNDKPYCNLPPPKPTPPPGTPTIPPPMCKPSSLCDVILSDVFAECHKIIPPKHYHEGCVFDACRIINDSVACSSLEIYASLCTAHGVCVDWRSKTAGHCPFNCPSGKIYNACGPIHAPACENRICLIWKQLHIKDMHDLSGKIYHNGFTEGCYCPSGTKLFNSYTDVCVASCSCVGPDGMPKKPAETWTSNCQQCVCEATSLTVQCKTVQCAEPATITCDKEGYIAVQLPDPNQPCCMINECRCSSTYCLNEVKICPLGFKAVPILLEGDCCTTYDCKPMEVCVFHEAIYQPGKPIPQNKESCEECICTEEKDAKTKLNMITCYTVFCNKVCDAGYLYEDIEGQCCGECKQEKRLTRVYWTLTDSRGRIAGDRCLESTIKMSEDGCCKTCDIAIECQVRKQPTRIKTKTCESDQTVELTYCEGRCMTTSIYSSDANAMQHAWSCCQERKTSKRQINLTCLDGTSSLYSYIYIEQCGCTTTECKVGYAIYKCMVKPATFTNHNGQVCSSWGNFHYKSFDGTIFTFPGTCNYILSSHCKSSYEDFNIQIRRTVQDGRPVISHITMTIDGMQVEMFNQSVMVNGVLVIDSSRGTTWDARLKEMPNDKSRIHFEKTGKYIKMRGKIGLSILWNQEENIMLELDSKYVNQTCGLCGDFNQVHGHTEFMLNGIELSPVEFGPDVEAGCIVCFCSWPSSSPVRGARKQKLRAEQCVLLKRIAMKEGICKKILTSSAFSKCNEIVEPTDYIHVCEHDLCSCDSANLDFCMCNVFAEYSRQCAHSGGHPGNWRTSKLCFSSCPFNMVYKECGSPCVDTCFNSERSQLCEDHCLDGCFCPTGTVLDDINHTGCIPQEECFCVYNNENYSPGSSYQTPCRACTCFNGRWSCKEIPCAASCSVEGGSHITTFDKTDYTIHGDCSYVFVKASNKSDFSVLVELRQCGISKTNSCLKSVLLSLQGGETNVVIKPNGNVFLNQRSTQLPVSAANVRILKPSSFYIIVETQSGMQLQVQTSPIMQLRAILQPSHQKQTSGLCGNFNNIQTDDFHAISGVIEGTSASFANTWKIQHSCPNIVNIYEDPCSLNVEKGKYAEHWCALLTASEGPFSQCHSLESPLKYYSTCLYDTCSCTDSEDCMCAALSSYAYACAKKGVTLIGWRENICNKYTKTCKSSEEYSYSVTQSQPSCRALSNIDMASGITFFPVDGCVCRKGTYMDDSGNCVAISDCPCYYNGIAMESGEVAHEHGVMCICNQGHLSCSGSTVTQPACSPPLVYHNCSSAAKGTKGIECQKSCHTLDMDCYNSYCISGCVCPKGLVLDDEENCIPEHECPCIHNEATYSHGEAITVGCNTCTCKARKWHCTHKNCMVTCAVYGNGHYKTFDGKIYNFNGDCEYTLAQLDKGNSFHVVTRNSPCGSTGTTCSKTIKIFLGQFWDDLKNTGKGCSPSDRPDEDLIVEARGRAPLQSAETEILREPFLPGIFMVIKLQNEITIMWDKRTSLFIKLPSDFKGNMCGLCGNYDGNANNDFTTRSLSVVENVIEFGNSWKLDPTCANALESKDEDPCFANPYRKSWAQRQCCVLCAVCCVCCVLLVLPNVGVNPVPFYEACVNDACACDSGGDCECFCTAVASYAQACSEAGVCITWRTPTVCPLFCDYHNSIGECEWHYKPCGHRCMKTCKNPKGECQYGLLGCEGCYPDCPASRPYFNEETLKCVAQCGCYDKNKNLYNYGEKVLSEENCQSCWCTMEGISCNYDITECHCNYEGQSFPLNESIEIMNYTTGECKIVTCTDNGTVIINTSQCESVFISEKPIKLYTTSHKDISENTLSSSKVLSTDMKSRETSTKYSPFINTLKIFSTTKSANQEKTTYHQTDTTKVTTETSVTSSSSAAPTTCQPECHWTAWIDENHPKSQNEGDRESFEISLGKGKRVCKSKVHIKDIRCRANTFPDVPLAELDQDITCDLPSGLTCMNDKNARHKTCLDFEISYLCCDDDRLCSTISPPVSTTSTPVTKTLFQPGLTSSLSPPHISTQPTYGYPPSTASSAVYKQTSQANTFPTRKTSTVSTMKVTTETSVTSSSNAAPTTCQPECHWTAWIDENHPKSQNEGDRESFEISRGKGKRVCKSKVHIKDIRCRANIFPDVPLAELDQDITCDLPSGLTCINHKNARHKTCLDYEISYLCCDDDRLCSTISPPVSTTSTPVTKTLFQPGLTSSLSPPHISTQPTYGYPPSTASSAVYKETSQANTFPTGKTSTVSTTSTAVTKTLFQPGLTSSLSPPHISTQPTYGYPPSTASSAVYKETSQANTFPTGKTSTVSTTSTAVTKTLFQPGLTSSLSPPHISTQPTYGYPPSTASSAVYKETSQANTFPTGKTSTVSTTSTAVTKTLFQPGLTSSLSPPHISTQPTYGYPPSTASSAVYKETSQANTFPTGKTSTVSTTSTAVTKTLFQPGLTSSLSPPHISTQPTYGYPPSTASSAVYKETSQANTFPTGKTSTVSTTSTAVTKTLFQPGLTSSLSPPHISTQPTYGYPPSTASSAVYKETSQANTFPTGKTSTVSTTSTAVTKTLFQPGLTSSLSPPHISTQPTYGYPPSTASSAVYKETSQANTFPTGKTSTGLTCLNCKNAGHFKMCFNYEMSYLCCDDDRLCSTLSPPVSTTSTPVTKTLFQPGLTYSLSPPHISTQPTYGYPPSTASSAVYKETSQANTFPTGKTSTEQPDVCLFNGSTIAVGSNVTYEKDNCEVCECITTSDRPVMACKPIVCQENCQPGYTYVTKDSKCCGECVKTSCLLNDTVVIEPGNLWRPSGDKCTCYECEPGTLMVVKKVVVCPEESSVTCEEPATYSGYSSKEFIQKTGENLLGAQKQSSTEHIFSGKEESTRNFEDMHQNDLFIAEFVIVMEPDEDKDETMDKSNHSFSSAEGHYGSSVKPLSTTATIPLISVNKIHEKCQDDGTQNKNFQDRDQQLYSSMSASPLQFRQRYTNVMNTHNYTLSNNKYPILSKENDNSSFCPSVNTHENHSVERFSLASNKHMSSHESQELNIENLNSLRESPLTQSCDPTDSIKTGSSFGNISEIQSQCVPFLPRNSNEQLNVLSPLPIRIFKYPLCPSPSTLQSPYYGSSSTLSSAPLSPTPSHEINSRAPSRLSFLTSLLRSKKSSQKRPHAPDVNQYNLATHPSQSHLYLQNTDNPLTATRKSFSCFSLNNSNEFKTVQFQKQSDMLPSASESNISQPQSSFHQRPMRTLSPDAVYFKPPSCGLGPRKYISSPSTSRENLSPLNVKPPLNKYNYKPLKKYSIVGKARKVTLSPPVSPHKILDSQSNFISQTQTVSPNTRNYNTPSASFKARDHYYLTDIDHRPSVSPSTSMYITETNNFSHSDFKPFHKIPSENLKSKGDIDTPVNSNLSSYFNLLKPEKSSRKHEPICPSSDNAPSPTRSSLSRCSDFSSSQSLSYCSDHEHQQGTVRQTDNGCCQTCEPKVLPQKVCSVLSQSTYITSKGCKSKKPVELTYCEGNCKSSSMFSLKTQTMMDNCNCCKPTKLSKKQVELLCPNQTSMLYSYIYVNGCSCSPQECP